MGPSIEISTPKGRKSYHMANQVLEVTKGKLLSSIYYRSKTYTYQLYKI